MQAWLAAHYPNPAISGHRELASFFAEIAPDEAVLYDGYYDGVFTYFVRAGDEKFRRRVVLGNKLLYSTAMRMSGPKQVFAQTKDEILEMLQTRGGARWLALEIGIEDHEIAPYQTFTGNGQN